MIGWQIFMGDCLHVLREMPDHAFQMCVTSPPYWGLRDYGAEGQIGLEKTPEKYVAKMVEVFREVRRVLRDDGTLWLNLGDSYAGGNYRGGGIETASVKQRSNAGTTDFMAARANIPPGLKPKDLVGIPWRVAFALQADGWYLRQDIIWHKPNPMPESVTDRCTKAHEYIFLLSKSARYYYDAEAVKDAAVSGPQDRKRANGISVENQGKRRGDGNITANCGVTETRNRRSVWTVATHPYRGAHFATFPPKLIEPCILAGTSERGCCPQCGKPWERVVEKTGIEASRDMEPCKQARGVGRTGNGRDRALPGGYTADHRTTGWRPGCECGGDPVPCAVLDPFAGAGTTGLVSMNLGRRAVLVELNPEYAKLARERIEEAERKRMPTLPLAETP